MSGASSTFNTVWAYMKPNVFGSMIAYLAAQSVDVQAFHFWKRLTRGKHLWLRNNASTIVSQMLDTVLILSILYATGGLGPDIDSPGALLRLMRDSYLFKFAFALFDTPFFSLGVALLKRRVGAAEDGFATPAAVRS